MSGHSEIWEFPLGFKIPRKVLVLVDLDLSQLIDLVCAGAPREIVNKSKLERSIKEYYEILFWSSHFSPLEQEDPFWPVKAVLDRALDDPPF